MAEASELRWVFDGQQVLVVDDGAENRELVRLVLESAGLQVIEAENGAVALECVAKHHPALVLMDVQMPVMDGYTATRKLRERGYQQPVLALTANAMKGFEKDIEGCGFTGYLTKPVDIDALLAEIGRRLSGRQQAPTDYTPLDELDAIDALQIDQTKDGDAPAPAPTTAQRATPLAAALEPGPPIVSRLARHPRLAKVARTFCNTLPEKLVLMQEALLEERLDDLAALAHWLKGAGGTVGYDDFFEPAKQLEVHARAARLPELQQTLHDIQALAARVQAPPVQSAHSAAEV